MTALEARGYRVDLTSGRRGRAQQARLYRNYLAGRSKYPAAPPGQSMHDKGLAADFHIAPESGYRLAGEAWESMGGTWGGRFKDPIHFDARALLRPRSRRR